MRIHGAELGRGIGLLFMGSIFWISAIVNDDGGLWNLVPLIFGLLAFLLVPGSFKSAFENDPKPAAQRRYRRR